MHTCMQTHTHTQELRETQTWTKIEEHRLARAHTQTHTYSTQKTNSGMLRHFPPDIITFICFVIHLFRFCLYWGEVKASDANTWKTNEQKSNILGQRFLNRLDCFQTKPWFIFLAWEASAGLNQNFSPTV